jgi:hypothetical protein
MPNAIVVFSRLLNALIYTGIAAVSLVLLCCFWSCFQRFRDWRADRRRLAAETARGAPRAETALRALHAP